VQRLRQKSTPTIEQKNNSLLNFFLRFCFKSFAFYCTWERSETLLSCSHVNMLIDGPERCSFCFHENDDALSKCSRARVGVIPLRFKALVVLGDGPHWKHGPLVITFSYTSLSLMSPCPEWFLRDWVVVVQFLWIIPLPQSKLQGVRNWNILDKDLWI